MKRRGHLAIAIALLLPLVSPVHAATPKAGAKCTKVGATATASGKKFTCIKSGTKLVWNKGVTIKAATKPQVVAPAKPAVPSTFVPVKPEQKNEVKHLLALDPRISARSEMTALEICKTPDQTPETAPGNALVHRNGFPRPENSVYGKNSAKILVIPMIFNDLPFYAKSSSNGLSRKSDLEALESVIPNVSESFRQLASGRFEIQIDVLPESEWWVFKQNNPFLGGWGVNNFPVVMDLITTQKSNFKFDDYDSYVFLTGLGISGQSGIGAAQATFGERNKNGKAGTLNAVLMAGRWTDSGLWIHELGHALFAFEDLYLFDQTLDPGKSLGLVAPLDWDLMANVNLIEFLEWNKFLMGWLEDNEVRCLSNQSTSTHYLTSLSSGRESKLLAINLAPGVTLAAESRKTSTSSGLLIYLIDTNLNGGQGPVLAQRVLLSKGESKSILGWRISVLETDFDGVLFEAFKTDIEKYQPPLAKPQQDSPDLPSSAIKVTKGEVSLNGYLKARGIWEVTGQQSYRVYVTALEDSQKVFYESGFVNDSRSSLIMEISGLVCNKPLRMMTEFYTERDGKGDRVVIQNLNLGLLSCDDVAVKP